MNKDYGRSKTQLIIETAIRKYKCMSVVWLRRSEFKKETAIGKGRSIASMCPTSIESTEWDTRESSGNNTRQDVKMLERVS